MALTIRERRLPQLHISLDLPSCAGAANFRAAPASTSAAAAARPASSACRTSTGWRFSARERRRRVQVVHRRTSAVYALKVLHGGVGGGDHGRPPPPRRTSCGARPRRTWCAATPSWRRRRLPPPAPVTSRSCSSWWTAGRSPPSRPAPGVPEAAVAEVAAQALSGLACLHARRVVHRDIKPGNLLVSVDGEVKIADFGIAKVVPPRRGGEHRAAYEYEGTAAYMSPERFDSELHGDGADPFAADVWGLGVTVLELLMARYPLLPAGQKPSWAALCAPSASASSAAARRRGLAGAPGVPRRVPAQGPHEAAVRRASSHPPVRRREERGGVQARAPAASGRSVNWQRRRLRPCTEISLVTDKSYNCILSVSQYKNIVLSCTCPFFTNLNLNSNLTLAVTC